MKMENFQDTEKLGFSRVFSLKKIGQKREPLGGSKIKKTKEKTIRLMLVGRFGFDIVPKGLLMLLLISQLNHRQMEWLEFQL